MKNLLRWLSAILLLPINVTIIIPLVFFELDPSKSSDLEKGVALFIGLSGLILSISSVRLFAKKGGGHHTLHTHWNGHMSGFYFLKADESTSMPLFEDPRPGNVMNLLPEKDKSKVTYASSQIHYKVQPGRMMFFPSYMPHQYIVDMGYEPFRFIHWNCQAIPKGVLNVVQKK